MEFLFSNGEVGIVNVGENYVYANSPDEEFLLESYSNIAIRFKRLKTGEKWCVTDNVFTSYMLLAKPQLKLEL